MKKKPQHNELFSFWSVHIMTFKQDVSQQPKEQATLNGKKGPFHGFVA